MKTLQDEDRLTSAMIYGTDALQLQEEAVPENLKNVLLFMSSNGYLVPPSKDASKEKLWSESWKRIDRFLPDLRKELDLEEKTPEPQEAAIEQTAAPPPAAEKKEEEPSA